MKKVLIIGYGNPLREDDGVGWAVAAEISGWRVAGGTLQVETAHQLLPELAVPISQADLVIFVDASVEGEPGTVQQRLVRPEEGMRASFAHHFDAAGLLAYAQELYGRSPPAYLFTVTAAGLGYKEELSPVVAAALPTLLAQIRAVIDTPHLQQHLRP